MVYFILMIITFILSIIVNSLWLNADPKFKQLDIMVSSYDRNQFITSIFTIVTISVVMAVFWPATIVAAILATIFYFIKRNNNNKE